MNVQYGTSELYFNCKAASSVEACQHGIRDGTFHITTLGGAYLLLGSLLWCFLALLLLCMLTLDFHGSRVITASKHVGIELFTSYEDYSLEPLVAEIYVTRDPAAYYGIGVVKASQCGEGKMFTGKNKQSLQGKDSCHAGYREAGGWYLPLGSLLSGENPIMPTVQDPNGQVRTDAYSASEFFGKVCAPRATDDGPKVNGTIWEPLCELCKESGGSDPCAANPTQDGNPYYVSAVGVAA
eukprot:scaffold222057_cov18-Tisochrysis_lutea.AAC.1